MLLPRGWRFPCSKAALNLIATITICTITTTSTTTLPSPEQPIATSTNATASSPNPKLTGNPQEDYRYDPNLPRELKGYDLSDYPFYKRVPAVEFNFTCDDRHDGFYASIPHKCQVYHHCLFGQRYDFLCANYTAFDQKTFICQFASEVDCEGSENFFNRNEALYKEESTTSTTKRPNVAPLPRPIPCTPRHKRSTRSRSRLRTRPCIPQRSRPRPRPPPPQDYNYDYDYYDYDYSNPPLLRPANPPRENLNVNLPVQPPLQAAPPRIAFPQVPLQQSNQRLHVRRPLRPFANKGKIIKVIKKRTTTTTTTTTTPPPNYLDDEYYYEYYYYDDNNVLQPFSASTITTTTTTTTTTTPPPPRRRPIKNRLGFRARQGQGTKLQNRAQFLQQGAFRRGNSAVLQAQSVMVEEVPAAAVHLKDVPIVLENPPLAPGIHLSQDAALNQRIPVSQRRSARPFRRPQQPDSRQFRRRTNNNPINF